MAEGKQKKKKHIMFLNYNRLIIIMRTHAAVVASYIFFLRLLIAVFTQRRHFHHTGSRILQERKNELFPGRYLSL